MIPSFPTRQPLSCNSFCHLLLRNRMLEKIMTNWSLNFWGLDLACLVESSGEEDVTWNSSVASQGDWVHSEVFSTALPHAFTISDQHIFILSALVWHRRRPCQSLTAFSMTWKLIWWLSRYHLQFVSPGALPQICYPCFYLRNHGKSSGRPACW